MIKDKKGKPVADFPYRIVRADGRVVRGVTDAQGRTQRVGTGDASQALHIEPDSLD